MSHLERKPHWRCRAAQGIVLPLLGLLLPGCGETPPVPAPVNLQSEVPAAPAQKKLPAPLPTLARGDLVSAAGQAASEYAQGKQPAGPDPLVGRSFAIRIAFSCAGPAPAQPLDSQEPGLASSSWGSGGKTIDLRMTPGDWAGSALITQGGAAPTWEAVEGIWIPRPWLASESCPNVTVDPLQPGTPAPAPQTVGLAAVFEAGGSRIGRRNGRAYVFTIRPGGNALRVPPREGYRLALAGRIASFPDGRAIRCHAPGPDQRPVCVVAARLDRVAFETAEGDTLSEWRPG